MNRLPVIFRAERTKDGDVTAVFPTLVADVAGRYFTVYAHIGQHSGGSFTWYSSTRPARPDEYADLLDELQRIYGRGDEPCELVVYKRYTSQLRDAFRAEAARLRRVA